MLIVTAKAKEKLQEVLKRQTAEPEVALRVTPTHPAHNRLELVLDKEKRGDHVVQAKNGAAVLLIRPDLALSRGDRTALSKDHAPVPGSDAAYPRINPAGC